MAKLKLAPKKEKISSFNKKVFKVLIVDDEQSIHDITNITINSMDFIAFDVEILNALSAKEAKEIFTKHNDIAVALIDVVMETPEAGLELVDYIRHDLNNQDIRLIVRTGQANEFLQMEVVKKYDINDFKEKTELSVERLFTTIRTSIKQYEQIIELEHKYQDTYRQLTTNQLTQLPNRLKLIEDFSSKVGQTLILIDIIGFSIINETNGFDVGDNILQELGVFLHSMYGADFAVYHLHSDLFGLIPKDKSLENFKEIIEKIKEDISKLNFTTDNFNKTIETTIGVAYKSDNDIIKKAELALKEARAQGKNKIQFYNADLKIIKKIENVSYWGPKVKYAIDNNGLLAYSQPIYDLKTNELVKYELLVRLKYEDVIYAPDSFLEAADSSGQLYNIFKFMFEEGCRKSSQTGKCFSINISDTEFLQVGLCDFIEATIAKYKQDATKLTLEILEYNSITSNSDMKKTINYLHSLGINFAVDDFGVQCSNFGQIESIPISTIKIDGSFIKNINESKHSQIVVKTIQTFARETNMKLVAEYVCNKEVYEIVKELGIDYAQGYYLAKPELEIKLS